PTSRPGTSWPARSTIRGRCVSRQPVSRNSFDGVDSRTSSSTRSFPGSRVLPSPESPDVTEERRTAAVPDDRNRTRRHPVVVRRDRVGRPRTRPERPPRLRDAARPTSLPLLIAVLGPPTVFAVAYAASARVRSLALGLDLRLLTAMQA